jgi:hypothetical protein
VTPDQPDPLDPSDPGSVVPAPDGARSVERRPLIERVGLAFVAAILAVLFGGVAVAAWFGGELFLAIMGGIGCLMTAWVGGITLFRG